MRTTKLYEGLPIITIPEEAAADPTVQKMAELKLDVDQTAVMLHPDWQKGEFGRFLLSPNNELFWLDHGFINAYGQAYNEGYDLLLGENPASTLLVRLHSDGTADITRRTK